MYRKRMLNLLVSMVVVGIFIVSSIIKPKLGAYTLLFRWLLIIVLLIANISLLSISKKKKWGLSEWLEFTTFIVVNIFLIYLIVFRAGFWFRTITLTLILITIFTPHRTTREKRAEEIKREARILKSAEKKIEKYTEKKKISKANVKKPVKKYFASKKGTVFHKIKCKIGKRISKRNRVYFSTKEEALKKGYKPCKVCIK